MDEILEKYANGEIEVPRDELTALERDRLLSEGKEVDRPLAALDSGETLAPLIGCTLPEYYFSSQKMFELEMYIHETFNSDSAGLSTTLRGMAEAMGSQIKYEDYNIAQIKENAIENLDDVDNLDLVDIDRDGRLHIILEGLALVKENLGDVVPVSGTVTGPLTVAAMVVGTERLLKGMRKNPEKVHTLLEIVAENNNRYISRLLDMGVSVGFADPVSSTSLLRKNQYEEFSLPYLQKNVDYIKNNGGGCGLHICGGSRAIWELLIQTGIGCFGPDNIESMAEAKEVLGSTMAIQGNVPPIEALLLGNVKDVLRESFKSLSEAYDSPCGFTLTSGCQTPMNTPIENMHAMMDAARLWPLVKDRIAEEF